MQCYSPTSLAKATVPELKAYCKTRNLKTGGKKDDLLNRLLEFINSNKDTQNNNTNEPVKCEKPKATISKAKKESTILDKMKSSTCDTIKISRNQYGNYEHTKTGLILDKFDKKVIGKQSVDSNGDSLILPLTSEDIEQCNFYKFDYVLPVNLGSGSTLKNEDLNGELDIDNFENIEDIENQENSDDDDDDDLEEFYDDE